MKNLLSFSVFFALLLILTGCGASEAFSLLAEPAVPLAAGFSQTITREQAQEIALKYAGFASQEVTGLRTDFDWDDNRWDVDFRAGDWEHEYDIHAETGEIIKVDKEYAPGSVPETQPADTSARLTAEEVKAIALAHAGVGTDQLRFLRVEFDIDQGIPRYEVEFVSDGWEYEYEIHAETGTILSFDKDK